VVSALNAVLAQRLLRQVCNLCAEPVAPSPADMSLLGDDPGQPLQLRRGRGCAHCHGSGYRGRQAVAELIRDRYGVELAVRTMGLYLGRWGFTPQKPMKKAYVQSPAAVKKWLDS
jgi:type II secretory ATPase GspE/PulE/Tfp pilus assembly ATPase PilB-like protein